MSESRVTPPRKWRSDEYGFGWLMLGVVVLIALLGLGVIVAGIAWSLQTNVPAFLVGAIGGLLVTLWFAAARS